MNNIQRIIEKYECPIKLGNRAFFENRYLDAIEFYRINLLISSPLDKSAKFNQKILLKRINSKADNNNGVSNDLVFSPVNQLNPDTDDSRFWFSTGDDPHFHLSKKNGSVFHAGWYHVRFLIKASHHKAVAKIYFDHGAGFSEAEAIVLPYRSEELISRIIYLESDCMLMRFDPKEREGHFRILALEMVAIDEELAIDRMLDKLFECRIGGDVPRLEGQQRALLELQRELCAQATEAAEAVPQFLLKRYNEALAYRPGHVSYAEWIETKEKAELPGPQQVRQWLEGFVQQPLMSIVMPTYNTDATYLRACIESVLAQSYPHWELCIADDASSKPHVRQVLEHYRQMDTRVKVCFRKKNGHISRASNSALALARGEFVALLDHDDTLPEHALLFMVDAINRQPDAQVLYSDEDKIDGQGARFDPHFKSDWNPDLFYSQNYVSHLGIYRRALLEKIGGFRVGFEGSQDQDLLLRCLRHVQDKQIVHIPRILYHWRMVEGSTAMAASEKTYTTEAGVRALRDYFATENPAVKVVPGLVTNTYRLQWPISEPSPLVSLLIPTRDHWKLTETCVRSILEKTTYKNYEILILDNGSIESETLAFFEIIQQENSQVRVLRYDHPFNYSAINNFGVSRSCGEIVGLVNNDIEVISSEWLSEMVSHAIRPDIGCVGAKLYYSNDTIQHAGVICSIGGVAGHSHKHFPRTASGYFSRLLLTQSLSAVTAACLLVRRKIYESVSGLDEEHLSVAFNDIDFCLKVRQLGYRNLWTPYSELYHHESVSRGQENTAEKITRFNREVLHMKNKWSSVLAEDKYYNPNLTKIREDFSIQ